MDSLAEVSYCGRCGFPTEYCEYNPRCTTNAGQSPQPQKPATKKGKEVKIHVMKKRILGNKYITIIRNLDALLPASEIKSIAKGFSKKIACGSTISKNSVGSEDVIVQTGEDLRILDLLSKIPGIDPSWIEHVKK